MQPKRWGVETLIMLVPEDKDTFNLDELFELALKTDGNFHKGEEIDRIQGKQIAQDYLVSNEHIKLVKDREFKLLKSKTQILEEIRTSS